MREETEKVADEQGAWKKMMNEGKNHLVLKNRC